MPKLVYVRKGNTDFRDTLAVLATVKDGPGNATRVLALEEKGLGLSILEAEDLAVATDVQLTLYINRISVYFHHSKPRPFEIKVIREIRSKVYMMTLKRLSMRIANPKIISFSQSSRSKSLECESTQRTFPG
jgi:hypothetical protein